jgi:hypothetical protein
MGDNIEGIARWSGTKPQSDHGSGDYVIELSRHAKHGMVYEVGWQKLMANGTSLAQVERRLYLLKDPESRWRFIGEGPEESNCKTGRGSSGTTRVTAQVSWDNGRSLPCRIEFRVTHRDMEWVPCDDEPRGLRPDRVLFDEWTLDGSSAKARRVSVRSYLRSEPGDTLGTIAAHLSAWTVGADDREKKPKIARIWREGVNRLNPTLGPLSAPVPPGSKIWVVTYQELFDALKADK